MEMLTYLSESEAGQTFLASIEEPIVEAADIFHNTPQEIKDYVMENLDSFLVPGDLTATFNKIAVFTESTVVQVLHDLSDKLSD